LIQVEKGNGAVAQRWLKLKDRRDMSVGRAAKFARVAAGIKQKDLADRLDVSPNYLSLVENNKREPSISFLRNLAGELAIPIGLLFLNVDSDLSEVSPEERALLLRIQDFIFQIQQIKLNNEAR
jgi:transcriptional regulator with XRE-family HTH domain